MTDQTRLDVGDQHGDEEKSRETSGHDSVTFDCDHCEAVLRTGTITAMKDRGTTHLEAHKATLFEVFDDKRRGKHCQNECGYVFSADGDHGSSHERRFECPQCGHDNFEAFAHRYLYWRIDYPETVLGESDRE